MNSTPPNPLYTLALLAEQERLLAERAQRVYNNIHSNQSSDVGGSHQLLSLSLLRPQPSLLQPQQQFLNRGNQLQHGHVSSSSSRDSSFRPGASPGEAAHAVDLIPSGNHRPVMMTSLPMVDGKKQIVPMVTTHPINNQSLPTKETLPMASTHPTDNYNQNFLPVKVTFASEKTSNERRVGKIRYYNEALGKYGPWKDIGVHRKQVGDTDKDETITLNLSRGGTLRILCNILPQNQRKYLSKSMLDCKLYRQYSLSRNDRLNFIGFQEPRSHVLLSSRVKLSSFGEDDNGIDNSIGEHYQPGYTYHGVQMKALPIDLVPDVASYAEELARRYNLPQHQWDIGVDLIVYKDGGDSIGWHSDDTQGESIVVCVVVDAPGEVRPLLIRPNKRSKALSEGDEEIQLFIAEGDGYDMDGEMQAHYEHSLPKKLKHDSHRLVLIFRHGNVTSVPQDSGVPLLKKGGVEEWNLVSAITKLRPKLDTVSFGHCNVREGESYSRRMVSIRCIKCMNCACLLS